MSLFRMCRYPQSRLDSCRSSGINEAYAKSSIARGRELGRSTERRNHRKPVAELKRQIAAASHVRVKEYIDDGVSGPLLDRPALNQLREDAKGDVYDAVYFLDADRIARVVAYQTIIIEELLKCGKQIIIKGQNYADNPENKFTLQMLGVVAEYEHAKIIKRTTRGRLHRLRQGEMTSNGHRIFGYRLERM